jgi:hypothetical protein
MLKPRTDLPKHVDECLRDLYVRIGLPQLSTRLLEEVLSRQEAMLFAKRGFTENALPIDRAAAILQIVARQRSLSLERALLDLSRELDLIAEGRYEIMTRAIDEVDREKIIPNWEASSGELRFNGVVLRTFSGKAKNIRLLLDSFQECRWKKRIDSPFPPATRQLRNTVESLNDDLQSISFRCDGSGKGVEWQECPNTGAAPAHDGLRGAAERQNKARHT